ncbi:PEP/pyruvate-binding domain-containing protein [Nocardia carnea]|uniref:PEP/pyruvate-binding domain-containing protein n=1 Tax=Nocardia carnea TaxID=37328 RepID=UPI0024560E33|nr:PEP/pyruvate-binding domain-containing protein [Nocardia carnea]
MLGASDGEADIAAFGGGKARGLYALGVAGARVPDWRVLGSDVFAEFVAAAGLRKPIGELAEAGDLETALELARRIRADIAGAETVFDDCGIRELVAAAHSRLGADRLAVRSSVAGEDGESDSFAGLFDSYLNIGPAELGERVRDCWLSGFSDRVVRYAFARGRPPVTEIAVLLQRFVPARASGVLFTRNPATGSAAQVVVSAVYGLGEGLVSGAVDADTVVVDEAGTVVERTVGDKDIEYVPADGAGLAVVDVPGHRRTAAVLGDAEVTLLADRGRGLAEALGGPQDFEWAIDDVGLWFLQARPITGLRENPADAGRSAPGGHRGLRLLPAGPVAGAAVLRGAGEPLAPGDLRIWDNSNIIESFQGLTSPLTFTVAAGIYGRVYRGYAKSLGVPENQVRQTDSWTPYLLGCFHGRVYYNLLHWYRMVGIAPGYPLNRKVLEAALGVAEPLPDELAETLRPFTFGSWPQRVWSRSRTTALYIRRIFGIDAMMREFCTEFYRVYDRYDAMEYVHGEHAYAAYRRVDRDLVLRWGPMMVLDAILLTLTGTMFLLTKAFLPQAPESLLYALVGPGAEIESAEPARALTELARRAHTDPDLTALLLSTDPDLTYAALRAGGYREFLTDIDSYLDRYGYRSVDELKLEAPDLREEPAGLFVLLRSALGRIAAPEPVGAAAPLDPDAYLDAHLRGIRRWLYDRVRRKTARCAAHRERLRFCRTRAFGMVKRMIRVMGRDLAARGVIGEFTDVFYLTVDELRNCYDQVPMPDLADRITARKIARTAAAELVAPARFTTVGPDFTDAELAAQGWIPLTDTPAAVPGDVLAGTPSAAGVVEGTAVLVDEPRDVAGGILVAYRTDPGWVAALPSASALVIERGSPLTHVAIVARELGVPTVVQVPGSSRKLRTGMRIRVDGAAGTVTVLPGGGHGDGAG